MSTASTYGLASSSDKPSFMATGLVYWPYVGRVGSNAKRPAVTWAMAEGGVRPCAVAVHETGPACCGISPQRLLPSASSNHWKPTKVLPSPARGGGPVMNHCPAARIDADSAALYPL